MAMLLTAALALALPLHFERFTGQGRASQGYLAATSQYILFLSDTGIQMRFAESREPLRMNLPHARLEALDRLPGATNYYLGADRSVWRTGVPNYGRVRYLAVFPGVDLVIYGNARQVEYDWVIAPGADASAIRFSFTGASGLRLDGNGDLVIANGAGEVRHRRPSIYQREGARTHAIEGGFVLAGGEVRFRLGKYDPRLSLVIDPQLVFAAGFGGSGVGVDFPMTHFSYNDTGTAIATDRSGNVYVMGTMFSRDFPLVNSSASPPSCPLGCDVRALFVAKLAPDGSSLLYTTYFGAVTEQPGIAGPSDWTYPGLLPGGMAVDSSGNVYVTGGTSGANFPFSGQATTHGGQDAFVVELGSNGALVQSTLFGGSADDAGAAIILGPDGFLYLAGNTRSTDFPTTSGAYRTAYAGNLFLMKIAPQTLKTVYSTFLNNGSGPSVAADPSGAVYLAASTTDPAWPTTSGVSQAQCAGPSCADAIVVKMNPAGSQLVYATYFGGSGTETLGALAIDAGGNAYISGTTGSTDLPATQGAFQAKWTPASTYAQAAFAARFTPTGGLSYATYLAGSTSDQAQAVAVDSAGNAYVGGETLSADFPLVNPIQASLYNAICGTYTVSGTAVIGEEYCASAGFISVLNAGGTGLLWSTFVGSGAIDMGSFGGYAGGRAVQALALDSAGNLYATGIDLDFTAPALGASTTRSAGVLKIAPQPAGLQFAWNSLTSAASYHPGLPPPGGLATLFVSGLNVSGIQTASGTPLPTEMAGVSIFVLGVPAPILAVASLPSGMQQINFQVPFEANLQAADATLVEVRYQGVSTFIVPQIVGPGIFLLGDGSPAIQHTADYSLVTPANPAHSGETIVIYVTGLGAVSPAVASGVAATGPAPATCTPSAVESPDVPAVGGILYAGLTPGYVGLYQMNVQLADNLPSGALSLYVNTSCPWPFGLFGNVPVNVTQSNTVILSVQ